MDIDLSHKVCDSPRKRRLSGIRSRMVICFSAAFASILAAIVLVQFFGAPFTSYRGVWETYKFEAMHDLDLVADLKEERLQLWVTERRNDLRALASNRQRLAALQSLQKEMRAWRTEGIKENAIGRQLLEQRVFRDLVDPLNEVKATHGVYETMFIVDTETGATIVSTQESGLGADNRREAYFCRALESDNDYVSDVQCSDGGDRPVIYFSRVIRSGQDKLEAVMVLEANAEEMIAPILHTGQGLGDRGEALLVNRELRILTSLKHPLADGSRAKPLEHLITTQPATRAARGEKGVIEATDYRGERVLAAYRYIHITSGLGWGLVVKRDLAELYAPLYREAACSLGIALLGLGAVVALAILVAQNLTKPIRALCHSAQLVAHGDLTVRAAVASHDEVGVLAALFNAMIARIQTDQVVRARQERLAAIGQLTASVAHELRNPMGTIRTACYVISGRLRGQRPDLAHPLDAVERSISRCDGIVADLLDYGRSLSLQRTPIAIDAWLEQFFSEHEMPEEIRLRCDLAAGITLPLDEERLRRCMVNLVTNACHAMHPPGGELTITSRLQDGVVLLSVADTGCGIPADQQEQVFEPLYSTKSFGVGLGLPIVKQIVEQHGGRLTLQSTPGQGTTFSIALPVSSADCPATPG